MPQLQPEPSFSPVLTSNIWAQEMFAGLQAGKRRRKRPAATPKKKQSPAKLPALSPMAVSLKEGTSPCKLGLSLPSLDAVPCFADQMSQKIILVVNYQCC